MKIHVSYSVQTGINKAVCDDSALIGSAVINASSGEYELEAPCVIALCDGVGGNAGGRDASMFVCEGLKTADFDNLGDSLRALNASLVAFAADMGEKKRMATTMTALFMGECGCFLAHTGNTRLYELRGGFTRQLTTDHTTYQYLLSAGYPERAEACNKSEITSAFGGGDTRILSRLDISRVFERGLPKSLLLTTDGVHDTLSQDEIEAFLASAQSDSALCAALCAAAAEKGSCDDRSACVIRFLP